MDWFTATPDTAYGYGAEQGSLTAGMTASPVSYSAGIDKVLETTAGANYGYNDSILSGASSLSGLSSMMPIPSLTGGAGGAAGPATNKADSMFDSSGWNVNFGAGTIESSANKSGLNQFLPYILIAAGLIAWKIYKKS